MSKKANVNPQRIMPEARIETARHIFQIVFKKLNKQRAGAGKIIGKFKKVLSRRTASQIVEEIYSIIDARLTV